MVAHCSLTSNQKYFWPLGHSSSCLFFIIKFSSLDDQSNIQGSFVSHWQQSNEIETQFIDSYFVRIWFRQTTKQKIIRSILIAARNTERNDNNYMIVVWSIQRTFVCCSLCLQSVFRRFVRFFVADFRNFRLGIRVSDRLRRLHVFIRCCRQLLSRTHRYACIFAWRLQWILSSNSIKSQHIQSKNIQSNIESHRHRFESSRLFKRKPKTKKVHFSKVFVFVQSRVIKSTLYCFHTCKLSVHS